jgi:hypothetical protein
VKCHRPRTRKAGYGTNLTQGYGSMPRTRIKFGILYSYRHCAKFILKAKTPVILKREDSIQGMGCYVIPISHSRPENTHSAQPQHDNLRLFNNKMHISYHIGSHIYIEPQTIPQSKKSLVSFNHIYCYSPPTLKSAVKSLRITRFSKPS